MVEIFEVEFEMSNEDVMQCLNDNAALCKENEDLKAQVKLLKTQIEILRERFE